MQISFETCEQVLRHKAGEDYTLLGRQYSLEDNLIKFETSVGASVKYSSSSRYVYMCILMDVLYSHKFSFKQCICILFNDMFQNFRTELIPRSITDCGIRKRMYNYRLQSTSNLLTSVNEQKAIIAITIHHITVLLVLHCRAQKCRGSGKLITLYFHYFLSIGIRI